MKTMQDTTRYISTNHRRRGSVLIVASWILIVLTGITLLLCREMRVESTASANDVVAMQADSVARGALAYIASRLQASPGTIPTETDMPCEALPVGGGYLWILRHDLEDDRNPAFGLTDESSKLNINSASIDSMTRLPGVTQEIAAAIVDWRDSDENPQPSGAESQYYLLQPDPYNTKNDRFETLQELLLVRDITPLILFGEDMNRNGLLDANENDGDQSDPPDNRDGKLDRGLADYVTLSNRENNTSASGGARTNVNDTGRLRDLLRGVLEKARADVIAEKAQTNRNTLPGRQFLNIFQFYTGSGITRDEFAKVADRLTASQSRTLQGLVNVNTASRVVLRCLPGIEDSDVESLISHRSGADLTNIAWVVDAVSDPKKLAAIGGSITVHSYRCSAEILAVDAHGRAFKRYFAIIDNRRSPVRVRHFQDITGLGWPLDPQILTDLHNGKSITPVGSSGRAGMKL